MPRLARVVAPHVPHHVTQRGNNRQHVFFCDDDRLAYLEQLAAECAKHDVEIHGYCLMTNHVHLVATPPFEKSLALAIGRAHWKYTQYINRLHGRNGHLWQGRFFSAALDEAHFWTTLAYVERNPIRAGMANRAWEYPWSSAAAHVGRPVHPSTLAQVRRPAQSARAMKSLAIPGSRPTGSVGSLHETARALLDLAKWERMTGKLDWEAVLARPDDHERVRALLRCTRTGRPLGSDNFISKLEAKMGRRLHALTVGRPKRSRAHRSQ